MKILRALIKMEKVVLSDEHPLAVHGQVGVKQLYYVLQEELRISEVGRITEDWSRMR
jgi:hypothetical protein